MRKKDLLSCVGRAWIVMLICAAEILIVSANRLEAQGIAATVQGAVSDVTPAVVPGATVTATNLETNLRRSAPSNSQGFYVLSNLPPGRYRVEASAPGFRTSVHESVVLAVGQVLVLNTTLEVGEITQQMTVSAEAVTVEATTSAVSSAVSPERVQELPLVSRDFRDLTSLVPGVLPMPASYTGSALGSRSLSTREFRSSVAGGRMGATAFLLDGLHLNTRNGMAPAGVSGGQLGIDMIREFRVLVNSYGAEYGRNASGAITMVSRSGTNTFHGSVFDFLRNSSLNARNFFNIPNKAPLRRNQFGFSVGGPIVKDKTFFFVNWEGVREREGLSVLTRVPDLNARRGLLPNAQGNLVPADNRIGDRYGQAVMNLYPLPNTGRNFGGGIGENNTLFARPTRDDLASLRIDHRLTENHSFFVRSTVDDGVNKSPSTQPTFVTIPRIRNVWITLQEDWVVRPNLVNTFRAGLARGTESSHTQAPGITVDSILIIPERWDIPSFAIASMPSTSSTGVLPRTKLAFNVFQYSNDLLATYGKHTMKFGARFDRYRRNVQASPASKDGHASGNGGWMFLTLQDFFEERPFQFQDSIIQQGVRRSQGNRYTLFGAYFQDEYRVLSNLTLNWGLRVEHQTIVTRDPVAYELVNIFSDGFTSPVESLYETDPVVSPRVGLAWTPLRTDQSFVVRAGAGIFYDQLSDGFYSNGMGINYPYSTQTIPARTPPFPNPYPNNVFPPPQQSNAFAYEDRQNVPSIYQYSFSLAKSFLEKVQMTAAYVGSQGRHLTVSKNVNTFPRSIVNGRVFYDKTGPRRNPNYGAEIFLRSTEGNSYYNSFQFGVKSAISQGLTAEGAYTFSKCIDAASAENTGDFGALREAFSYDAYDMKNNRGRCNMDIRQRLALNFLYDLPFRNLQGIGKALLGGWTISSIIQLSDGAPFTTRVNFPRSNNAVNTGNSRQERPDLAPGAVVSERVFPGNPDRYYDPTMFVLQPEGFLGNAGRNLIVGPGLATVDLSLRRDIPLREKVQVQFRAEFFNLFNRVNFGLPDWLVFTDTSGRQSGSAGRITNTSTSSRQVQFALKLVF